MASRAEVEIRLRGYAQEYDREFPSTTRVEGRIMARISITPRDLRAGAVVRPRWSLAGVLVRQLALVCVLLIVVGVLAIGVSKLRAMQRHNVPTIGVPPGKLDVYFSALDFVSADQGWIAETKASNSPSQVGPTVVYRTTDGGRTWQRQLSWDGPGPEQVRFSADGKQGLVVGRGGVPLFQTSDGGATWERMSLPPAATQVAQLYFLDSREGWVISYLNEATPGFAGVFNTTDGGRTWTQTARLDVNKDFSYGPGGSLQGQLVFRDSSTGWFVGSNYSGTNIPVVELHLFVTSDGGRSWAVQALSTTAEAALNSGNASISSPQFVNQLQGVLLVTKFSAPGAQQGPAVLGTYVYTTADGGASWSAPRAITLPAAPGLVRSLSLVDASHWFVVSDSGIFRTTDAGAHWGPLTSSPPSSDYVLAVEFQDVDIAWVEVGGRGAHPALALYRTTDGGVHWTRFSVPSLP
jgi:photosystem II stability/assembly factor-like uncharacterized protein